MITLPNGKICMNEQEAIQWLLDNYPIPFQCSANYAAGTEIGLGTIVNPTPAKVKVGSIIFFADSKVSTVVGLTANGFICSDQYNDLVDDIVYVSNVQLNASGHLITTLSNGTNIDAGLIKQLSSFSINASQHLIANYNDGTSADLGAIFNGNVNIAGNLTADSIVENMTGYSFTALNDTNWTPVYVGAVKNGNKLTLVVFGSYTHSASTPADLIVGYFTVPASIGAKLYPYNAGSLTTVLEQKLVNFFDNSSFSQLPLTPIGELQKLSGTTVYVILRKMTSSSLVEGRTYMFRYEATFLLSDNLAA